MAIDPTAITPAPTVAPTAAFTTQEEEARYRAQQPIPTQASTPYIGAPAYSWTNGTANRYLSSNGGSTSVGGYLDRRYGPVRHGPEIVDAAQAGGHPVDTVGDVGRFTLSVSPERSYAPFDPAKDPPPRQIGDFEGLFGGLSRTLMGFLPQDQQNTLARVPELIGELFDAPFNLLRHDIPGFGVAESFERMADTPEKEELRRKIAAASPTWAHWYMTEYINTHMGDFSDAHGIPHALGQLLAPGQTPIGRAFGAMNVPAEASQRAIAGGMLDFLPGVEFDRVTELLNTPDDELHPTLLQIKQQYQRGDFDEDGLLDRMTSQGFGLTNDVFHGLLLSLITDPLILASFGTGSFARMVTKGGLMHRAARVEMAVMKLPEGDPLRIAMADSRIQAAAKPTSRGRYANRDLSYRATEDFIEKRVTNPAIEAVVREAESKLTGRQLAQVKLESIAKPANAISELLNSPFGIFGSNGAGRAVLRKYIADTSDGVHRGHGSGTATQLLSGISNQNGATEALGHYQAQLQRGLVIEGLHKQLRVQGRGESPFNMPDSINVEEYTKALDAMENPLSAREMESFVRATRRSYIPELSPDAPPEQHARELALWTKQMNENAAVKFAQATQIPIEEARRRIGKGGDEAWSLIDGLHWGRFTKDWADARNIDAQAAGMRMDAISQKRSAAYVEEQAKTSRTARATPVGPRELTESRAQETLVAVEKALSTNDSGDIGAALSAVSKYDQLRNTFFSQTKAADDHQMLLWMKRYLEQGIKDEAFVKTITNRADLDAPELWRLLDDTNARMAPGETYELGIGPTPDKAFQTVLDEEGNLVGYRAWIDVAADPAKTKLPTQMSNLRFRLLTPIRAEHILQENRRRFIRIGATEFGLREADTTALWSALRKAGLRGNRTLRSFKNDELEEIVNDAAISNEMKTKLGGPGLAKLAAQAMEGDIRMVGVLPKMTGKWKSGTAGKFNNNIGHVSEYIYPTLRFGISPLFLLQEYIEPFFFNILRGVKVGMKENPENSAFRQTVFSIGGDELMAHDAMAREIRTVGVYASRQAANPNTQIGRAVLGRTGRLTQRLGFSGIASTKWMAHTNIVLERWGAMVKKMIDDAEVAAKQAAGQGVKTEWDDAWPKIRNEMQRLVDEGQIKYKDPKTGAEVVFKQRNLSDGEVARLYMEQSGITLNGRRWQTLLWDGQNPSTLGRVSAIRQSDLAELFGRDSGATLRSDIANGVIDQWEFRGKLSRLGFDPDYTRRAWDMMTGPSSQEFFDSVELAFRQAGRTPLQAQQASLLMRAHLETYAVHHGLSDEFLEEAIARKFNKSAQYLNANQTLPSNAHPQSVVRIITDNGGDIADESAGTSLRNSVGDAISGEVITGTELVGPDDWRRGAIDDLDEQTLAAVADFDQDLARLTASVISDPDDAARVFDVIRSDPERGFALLSTLASQGGDLQAMLDTFVREAPPAHYADIAAEMNIGSGFMGKTDWTARDVLNVERARQARKVPPLPEQEFDLSVGIEQQLPLHQMSADIGQTVSAEVAPLVAESVGRRTGARVLSIEDSMEGLLDPGALVSRGTRFVVSGTDEQLQRAADEMSVLTGRDEVYVSRDDAGRTTIGFEPTENVIYTAKRIDLDDELRRELDETILSADDALMQMDEEAWTSNRARYEHASKFDPRYRYQTLARGRGWRGATVFDRRQRATLYLNDNADLTTIVHETFHTFARDLDRSGKKALTDAYKASRAYTRIAVPARPTGAALMRKAEEWAADQFEAYSASGLASDPSLRLHPIFNAYADWGRRTGTIPNTRINAIDPRLQAMFGRMTPEVHGKNVAVFDVQQFRVMEAMRIALLRAEDEAHTTTYFRRNKTFLERSINHPFFGLYPLSYMYGKVLPELMRFMVKKPFGVDAPLAGAAMWDHVYDAAMLEMSGNTEFADVLNDNPEAIRFLTLLLPGLPNDINVNMPAWSRRVLRDSLAGEQVDFGKMFTDYLGYAMTDRASPESIMDGLAETQSLGRGVTDVFSGGQYRSEADIEIEESQREMQEGMYRNFAP